MNPKQIKPFVFTLIISVTITLITSFLIYFLIQEKHFLILFIYGFLTWFISFLIIYYGIKWFINQQIQQIYKEIPFLKKAYNNQSLNIRSLENEITKFVQHKKDEIQELKYIEKYRKEFMGNVSHELNTPLFTTQSYILTLLEGNIDDKNIRKKYLQRAAKGLERLIFIVKDLEMISQLETGRLTLNCTNFNIIEVIESTFELLELRAKKRNISLQFNKPYSPIEVYADREKIQQVLSNIIMNSIKYGKDNGTTEVSIENIESDKIIIKIADNGEGVAQENIHRLFERFYRVDKSGSRMQGGSGLGLSIVKHVIEAHQESVYVESQLGLGSEFSFTLKKKN